MNDIQNVTKQTPIEIALGIDEDGKTTASKLYEFLGLDKRNYARWTRNNITNNQFAEKGVDYFAFEAESENSDVVRSSLMTNEKYQPNPTQDFKLSANFAKKLSMQGKTEKAEQARNYFIAVEGKLKEIATKGMSHSISRLTITSLSIYKNNDWGILVMGGEIYNLTPEEYKELSGLVPKLQEMNVKQIPSVIEAYLALHERKRKLECTAQIVCDNTAAATEEETTVKALPDKEKKHRVPTKARCEDLNNALSLTDKQAQARYNMSRAGVMKLAEEARAVIRYGKRLRINREKLDAYIVKEYTD